MKKHLSDNYNRFVLFAWIAIAVLHALQNIARMPALLSLCYVIAIYPSTTYLSTRLLKKAMQRKTLLIFIVQVVVISAFTTLIIFFIYKLFPISIGNTPNVADWMSSLLSLLFINIGFCGLRFYEENLKLHKKLVDSQLQILQAQINPHFMFNVLNQIHVLMQRDTELASDLLLKYSDILRYQLYKGKREVISIEEEVEFLKNFIDIEKTRWKNKLNVDCTWEIENGRLEFPPLLLITFVENAFKHVLSSSSEKGYIDIKFIQRDKIVQLSVENSK